MLSQCYFGSTINKILWALWQSVIQIKCILYILLSKLQHKQMVFMTSLGPREHWIVKWKNLPIWSILVNQQHSEQPDIMPQPLPFLIQPCSCRHCLVFQFGRSSALMEGPGSGGESTSRDCLKEERVDRMVRETNGQFVKWQEPWDNRVSEGRQEKSYKVDLGRNR